MSCGRPAGGHTLHGSQAPPDPGRCWGEGMDGSTLSTHRGCASFYAVCVFLKNHIKTIGEILWKNMYKHNIESQPQSFVFQVRASQGIGKIPSL